MYSAGVAALAASVREAAALAGVVGGKLAALIASSAPADTLAAAVSCSAEDADTGNAAANQASALLAYLERLDGCILVGCMHSWVEAETAASIEGAAEERGWNLLAECVFVTEDARCLVVEGVAEVRDCVDGMAYRLASAERRMVSRSLCVDKAFGAGDGEASSDAPEVSGSSEAAIPYRPCLHHRHPCPSCP